MLYDMKEQTTSHLMAKFQVVAPFSITSKGKRTEFKMGDRISEIRYHRLSSRQQSRFLPARRCGAQSWTNAEYAALAQAYVNHAGDRPAIIDAFRLVSSRHTDAALDIAAQACRELDLYVQDSTGLKDHAAGLLLALQDIDPDRFSSVQSEEKLSDSIDSLLESIRS
tara:strand:+ start:131 stop:631 length:501 start_codon:yes stop_codon:yes gene_type:complete